MNRDLWVLPRTQARTCPRKRGNSTRITFGYWTGTAGAIAKIAEEGYKNVSPEVAKLIRDEVKVMEALTWKLGVSPSQTRLAYKNTDADEVRSAEVSPFIMETITKVVVGKEDFAWFDQRVAEFQKKYGDLPQKSIDYYYTKRSELEKMGVIFFWEKY